MKPNRFYSKKQEKKVANATSSKVQPNSGATVFDKGDVINEHMLIECKTLTQERKQHAIKKDWLIKNQQEAIETGKSLSALAFDFGDGQNYYILSERDFMTLYSAYEEAINNEGSKKK